VDFGPDSKYGRDDFHPRKIRQITDLWQTVMPKCNGWNSVYLDNHDSGRSLSRYGSDAPEHRATAAKMLATYLSTLSGTPFLLAGQEIGMANLGPEYGAESYIDVEGLNYYNAVLEARGGDASQMSDVMRELQLKARDHGRLPMQWNGSRPNAGFTSEGAKPWMTINKDFVEWNVASQEGDDESVLAFWRQVLALRKKHTDLFVYGRYSPVDESVSGEEVLAYERFNEETGEKAVVLLSFSKEKKVVEGWSVMEVFLSNHPVNKHVDGRTELVPFGAVVLYAPS
jgi:oligo-1,6-glucosidase